MHLRFTPTDKTVFQHRAGLFRPKGIWYSHGVSWKNWCINENFHFERLRVTHELVIDKSNFLVVDHAYVETHPSTPNWEEIMKKYDGVDFPNYSKYGTDNTIMWGLGIVIECPFNWYNGIDCSSGCVWNEDCIKEVIRRPEYDYKQ